MQERNNVAWYWRLVALAATIVILGGFLMLQVTWDTGKKLRLLRAALGIFAAALLTAGFSFTALLCYAVRNPLWQADTIFLPALVSCTLGLLTVFYDFLISGQNTWNTPALLTAVVAAWSAIIFGGLLIWTHRKLSVVKTRGRSMPLRHVSVPSITPDAPLASATNAPPYRDPGWQENSYYENYNRNMFPTSVREPQPPQATGYDPNQMTEEEMQRQQMLMLLLTRDEPPTPDPSQSTFRIDWRDNDDDGAPANGYYAPSPQSAASRPSNSESSAYPYPSSALGGEIGLRPWDGVWRGPPQGARLAHSIQNRAREERRQAIEQGQE